MCDLACKECVHAWCIQRRAVMRLEAERDAAIAAKERAERQAGEALSLGMEQRVRAELAERQLAVAVDALENYRDNHGGIAQEQAERALARIKEMTCG